MVGSTVLIAPILAVIGAIQQIDCAKIPTLPDYHIKIDGTTYAVPATQYILTITQFGET
jgi:hypothetical protein